MELLNIKEVALQFSGEGWVGQLAGKNKFQLHTLYKSLFQSDEKPKMKSKFVVQAPLAENTGRYLYDLRNRTGFLK